MKQWTIRVLAGAALMLAGSHSLHAQPGQDTYKLPDKAQTYAVDEANYRLARKDEDQAKADVIKARQDALAQAKASPEYQAAVGSVERANDQYQATKKQVQADLTKSNEAYQKLLKDRDAADKRLADARKAGNTDFQTFQNLYAEKEKITNAMRTIEDAAMEKAGGADSRRAWSQACKSLDAMNQAQKAQVESAPQVAEAKQRVASAQKATDDAGVKLAGSQAAYDEASFQQGKSDDYYHHHRETLDYYDNDWGYGGYSATIYRAPRARAGGGGVGGRR